ncbi:hypothetical protein N9084_01570 [Flavobacteriales bacterium]|nr:hypothetical protein [Flavobacteriales bacterium]
MRISVPISSELRSESTPDVLWRGEDKGLMQAWEIGRRQSSDQSDVAKRAKQDELPASTIFQGGQDERLTTPVQFGSLHYYCMWLGWRGQDLEVDTDQEYPLVCSRTKMGVVFTIDSKKFLTSGMTKKQAEPYGEAFWAAAHGPRSGTQATSLL